jgi:pimeloyl-ACP methyl ester carboxylesterase
MKAPLLVYVHGFMARKQIFWPMKQRLMRRGLNGVLFGYRSMRATPQDHSEALLQLLDDLSDQHEELWVVGHSLGGILACAAMEERVPPSVKGLVLIACPIRGNDVARRVPGWLASKHLLGPALTELCSGLPDGNRWRVEPPISLGIIVGGTGYAEGVRSSLNEDNDGLVRVSECWHGMADARLLVKGRHNRMLMQLPAANAVQNFVLSGRFLWDEEVLAAQHGRSSELCLPIVGQPDHDEKTVHGR